MPSFTLEQLKKYTGCEVLKQDYDEFTDISTDTRNIKPGMVFLAIQGEKFDGHDFIDKALKKGAAGLIISDKNKLGSLDNITASVLYVPDTLQAYIDIAGGWRSGFSLPVLAITGSNGKTTTKDLTAAILAEKYNVLKTQKNFNSEIGMALTLLSLNSSHEAAVIEIGMRGLGQIETLCKAAKPDIGIVLNVGDTHLELLGSRENIARAKGELAEAIKPDGIVILNADDEYTAAMAAKTNAKVITFGIKKPADIMAENIHMTDDNKTSFTCILPDKEIKLSMPLIGEHNVYDALAAVAAGYIMKMEPEQIKNGLERFEPSGMRFEISKMNNYTVVNDAYNASPLSMAAAIKSLSVMAGSRRIVVFGDMKELGKIEREAHEKIGVLCVQNKIDVLITLGPLAEYAADAAAENGMKHVYKCSTHADIAAILNRILTNDDIVLFKGSHSMQMEKIINLLEKA